MIGEESEQEGMESCIKAVSNLNLIGKSALTSLERWDTPETNPGDVDESEIESDPSDLLNWD